jgi:hypothetical protein
MFVLIFLCCAVVCRKRPGEGPTPSKESYRVSKSMFRNLKQKWPESSRTVEPQRRKVTVLTINIRNVLIIIVSRR